MDIEQKFAQLESQMQQQRDDSRALTEAIKILIQQQQNLLTMSDSNNLSPTPVIPTPTDATPSTASQSKLKPGLPSDFNGDRAKGRAFLNSCDLYMRLCPKEFADDEAKVHWVLSYMKEDRAALFADRTLRQEAKTGQSRFPTWSAFRAVFIESFCPENEATFALLRLESERYFQGRRTVEAYIDEFEQLVDQSGYTEALVIVLKFRRGLCPSIQDKVAESGKDRPADNDTDGWYAAARRFDQNRLANEAFHTASTKRATAPSTPVAPPSRSAPPRFNFAPIAAPIAPPKPTPPPQSLSPGVPMDIDAQRANAPPPTCYRCGKPGHVKRDCPQQFDIRYMIGEEREEAIQALMAKLDAVTDEAKTVVEEKDF